MGHLIFGEALMFLHMIDPEKGISRGQTANYECCFFAETRRGATFDTIFTRNPQMIHFKQNVWRWSAVSGVSCVRCSSKESFLRPHKKCELQFNCRYLHNKKVSLA